MLWPSATTLFSDSSSSTPLPSVWTGYTSNSHGSTCARARHARSMPARAKTIVSRRIWSGASESSGGCRLGAELLRDPARELGRLAVAETGGRMQHSVVPGRHVAARDRLGDLVELPCFRPGVFRVVRPAREVQPAPPLLDVVVHDPGRRGDRAVPGPGGLVGMTVVARAVQDALDLGWCHEVALDCGIGGWVAHDLHRDGRRGRRQEALGQPAHGAWGGRPTWRR